MYLFLTSCEKGLELFQEKDLLERPTSKRCAECHENIYNQFKESRHAMSWISPEFKRGSESCSKEKCLSCHAPYEITINEKPKLRDVHRENGVVACHFRDSTKSMHGPYDVFSPPHPSTQDLTYTKAEICVQDAIKKRTNNGKWLARIKTVSNVICLRKKGA